MVTRQMMLVVSLCAVVFAIAFRMPLRTKILNTYEDVSFMHSPTAAHAFEIAEHHFGPVPNRAYDVRRARQYYLKTVALDPNYPMAYHELARTSFIIGMLNAALAEITLQINLHPDSRPSSYYVRALTYGFLGKYPEAQADYETYLKGGSHNWPGFNDYAWILLKEHKFTEALVALDTGLAYTPGNAWLLNSKATALYEMGRYDESRAVAESAAKAAQLLEPDDWAKVNPGNDPSMGAKGIEKLREAIAGNIKLIHAAIQKNATSSTR